MFLKACDSCHSIGKGDRIGPDLKGITSRRDRDWLINYMVSPSYMLAKKDPIAVKLNAKYGVVRMPDLDLSKNDAADLLAYLESQTKRLAASQIKKAGPHDHNSHKHQ